MVIASRDGAKGRLMTGGLIVAVLLAGCSQPPQAEADPAADASAAAAVPPGVEALKFENNEMRGDKSREFAYHWPAQVSAIPELVARFSAERDKALAEQKQEFEDALREFAGTDCISCVNRSYAKEWEMVADLPRFLSLSATVYIYSGGAHGNGAFDDLIWDREAGKALEAKDFFTSPAAMQQALGATWCKALRKERVKRLGDDYGEDASFTCPDIAQLNVLLGSAGKTAFDRIGLLAAPYVAGSYAEGAYEVTVPVSPAVLEAVKPEYRAYFAPAK